MKIAGIQYKVTTDVKANYEAISRGIAQAIDSEADILIMPEGGLSGYTHIFPQGEVEEAIEKLVKQAADGSLALALSTCYNEEDGKCYNQMRIYNKQGELEGFHSKILRCGNPDNLKLGEKTVYSPSELRIFELEGVKFGCLICNDFWANPQWTEEPDPHFTRQLAEMGAKIILHAVNSGFIDDDYMGVVKQFHESNLLVRANANDLWVATVNSAYDDYPCSSVSGFVAPNGTFAMQAPSLGEQFFCMDIDV